MNSSNTNIFPPLSIQVISMGTTIILRNQMYTSFVPESHLWAKRKQIRESNWYCRLGYSIMITATLWLLERIRVFSLFHSPSTNKSVVRKMWGWLNIHCLGLYYSNWIFCFFMCFSGPEYWFYLSPPYEGFIGDHFFLLSTDSTYSPVPEDQGGQIFSDMDFFPAVVLIQIVLYQFVIKLIQICYIQICYIQFRIKLDMWHKLFWRGA